MNNKSIDISTGDSINLFKHALETTADSVVITDVKGNIIWVNLAYEKLTGYTLQEVKGDNPRILKSGKQDISFYNDLWETISSGKVWQGELWNKRKDGSLYLEEQSITPSINESDNITHFIAIKRDITKQSQFQKQLNMAEKIEAIGKFTAGVAHNFNNKLASILGYAELATEEVEQYSNNELTDYLQEITVAGKLARDLVRQMMAFSRNDVNEVQSVDLSEVVQTTIKILEVSLPSTISLFSKLENIPNLSIDPVRLHQMIVSLVINASDAMGGTGIINIYVHTVKVENKICSSCQQAINGDYVELVVRDTGVGIKPNVLEQVFLPFFTTHEQEGGTGMGLSALHGMLHDQKGHVLIDTVVGVFTEFKLFLPTVNSKFSNITSHNHKSGDVADLPANSHIMIVDGEDLVANVLAEMLMNSGYDVVIETNSKVALRNYTSSPEKYDLIITDREMSDLNGIDFSKLIYDVDKNVPVILMSGHGVVVLDKLPKNVKSVLSKPFEAAKLIEAIKSI